MTSNFDGIEIGAVSVKWVRSSNNGAFVEVVRHEGKPIKKILDIYQNNQLTYDSNIVITGHATKRLLDLPYYSEIECIEKALAFYDIRPDILLSLGGETFNIYHMKNGFVKNIISTSKCAAGTGEFIIHQLQRMGLSIGEGIEKSKKGSYVELATRCAVHCKSDATHKLNKGECTTADIAKTLIYDLARKVSEMIKSSGWDANSIVLSGGLVLNKVFVENLKEILDGVEITILKESPYLKAFGASLYAMELKPNNPIASHNIWLKRPLNEYEMYEPLDISTHLIDYNVAESESKTKIVENGNYILAIDAGSTTTKAVLFNIADGSIGASVYLRTLGNPVTATRKCIENLVQKIGKESIQIIQSGTTGSAREMVSVYLDNCRSFNEILAHARSSSEIVPNVDTVFEIGGQDSKFISFLQGVPIDYAMNEGCSAGTGSFLEESASIDMGVEVKEISDIAIKSQQPIAFGERCAAFINTDIRNALQQGASKENIIAGLVYSIVDNYISRVVGPRHIGEDILFLGGVALNKSVSLAFASRLQKRVIVPEHPELMGSIGTALMVMDLIRESVITEKNYSLKDFLQGEMNVKGVFRCKACENNCEIQNISIRGKTYPFGGLCSKYRLLRQKNKLNEGFDLIAFRNNLMFNKFGPQHVKNSHGTILVPMALTSYELLPLYTKFIEEIGYNVLLVHPQETCNIKTTLCYPCELANSILEDILKLDIDYDYVFVPRVLELEVPEGYIHSYTCPSTAVIPDVLRTIFAEKNITILSPHICLSKELLPTTLKEFGIIASTLGLPSSLGVKAGEKALEHYTTFLETYRKQGEQKLNELLTQPTVVIAGRPYVVYSPEINLALPRKIVSRGYNTIPIDILPHISTGIQKRNVWSFTQQINNAILHVKRNPNLYFCLVSCFSCVPDGTMYHHFRRELEGETFCYLEIDTHTAHAGFETRVGAFLDIIEKRHEIQKNQLSGE